MTEAAAPPHGRPDARRAAPLAIASCFLAATAFLAYRLNIWQDEAYSLHTTAHGAWNGLRQGVVFEAQAPLYFGALGLWRTLDSSVLYARALSIIFSLVALAIAWSFARRYIRGVNPSIVLAAVALNPFNVWAAVEIRLYSAAIALSAALLYCFFRGWVDDEASPRARIAFVIIAIVAGYTQYFLVVFVFAGAVALAVLRPRSRLPSYLGCATAIGVALLPIVWMLPAQLAANRSLIAALPPYAILLAPLDYLYPHSWIGSWVHLPARNALYFILAALPVALAAGAAPRLDAAARAVGLIAAVICAMFGLFMAAHVSVIFPRHTAVLFLPTLLAAFALIGALPQRRRTVVLASFAAIYTSFALLTFWSEYRSLSKNGDWQRVGAFLNANVRPDDAVAVFDTEATLPLAHYFGQLALDPIPRPLGFDGFDERAFALNGAQAVDASLGPIVREHRRVWLVENDVCKTRPAFYGCRYLDAYVARRFLTVRTVAFNGSSVRELLRDPAR